MTHENPLAERPTVPSGRDASAVTTTTTTGTAAADAAAVRHAEWDRARRASALRACPPEVVAAAGASPAGPAAFIAAASAELRRRHGADDDGAAWFRQAAVAGVEFASRTLERRRAFGVLTTRLRRHWARLAAKSLAAPDERLAAGDLAALVAADHEWAHAREALALVVLALRTRDPMLRPLAGSIELVPALQAAIRHLQDCLRTLDLANAATPSGNAMAVTPDLGDLRVWRRKVLEAVCDLVGDTVLGTSDTVAETLIWEARAVEARLAADPEHAAVLVGEYWALAAGWEPPYPLLETTDVAALVLSAHLPTREVGAALAAVVPV